MRMEREAEREKEREAEREKERQTDRQTYIRRIELDSEHHPTLQT